MGKAINCINKEEIQWFVMHVYKREKEAEERLSAADGLPFYIPKYYKIKTSHGKKIKCLMPSIPGIIFVHASYNQILAFKQQYNMLQFSTWKKSSGTELLIVPDAEMENFIRVSSCIEEQIQYYEPEEINLEKGTRVRIIGGTLDGVEGVFVKVTGKRSRQVVVVIPDISAIAVEVKPDLLEVLPSD